MNDIKYPKSFCTSGEFDFLKKKYPDLVEKLGDYLVGNDDTTVVEDALPLCFIFFGTEKQRRFWMRDKDIDPRHVRLATDYRRIQGLRARVVDVCIDPFWIPMGVDERCALQSSDWECKKLIAMFGTLHDVVRMLHPEDDKKWIRLA